MQVVTKGTKIINTLAALLVVVGAVRGAGSGWAAPGDEAPARESASPEPVLTLEAPDGHCAYDAHQAGEAAGHETGFQPGLKSGTELLALYVPCAALEAARAGTAEWLPEWVAFEKNIVTYPSDDERSLGSYGAVKQLCRDAQSTQWGHSTYDGADFAEMVKTASAKLSIEKPEIFLGVVGEEEHACYLSALRIVYSPSGKAQRFLIVAAFMQAGDRWVTQSIRRQLSDAPADATAHFAAAKKEAKAFSDKNR
jgi:hypothetical protein